MLRVAHLLAAGCCTAAAELASLAGNVRLAALIQQVGFAVKHFALFKLYGTCLQASMTQRGLALPGSLT